MPARMCNRPGLGSLVAACFMLAATAAEVRAQIPPPKPHHPGQWTSPAPWPDRDFTDGNSVQAIHMALVRGDTLFARPHSQIVAWDHWSPLAEHQKSGGVWGWRPLTDDASLAHSNLAHIAISAPPPYDLYCGGHTTLPNGDLLIMSGTERGKTGENKSARFNTMDRTWVTSGMNSRRWYGNATTLGDGRVLATAGNRGHHMVVFGGQSKSGSNPAVLTNDVRRYAIIDGGQWDLPVTDPTPGSGTDWPDEREFATLTETKGGPHFLFGGLRGAVTLRDVWQLRRQDSDLAETYGWRQLAPQNPPSGPPLTRWRHIAVVDVGVQGVQDSVMYVHGGLSNEFAPPAVLNDFWKLQWYPSPSPGRWEWSDLTALAQANGFPTAARAGHTAIWDRKSRRMFMFGGQDASGNIVDDPNFYVISFPGGVPTCQIATPVGPDGSPSPRTRHAMAANNRDVASPSDGVLFGGYKLNGTTPELTNELWTFTVSTSGPLQVAWDRRDEGGGPPPRADASIIVYTETPTSYHVVGGELASDAWDADAWEYRYDPPVRWERLQLPAAALRGHRAVPEAVILTELQPEIYDPATNLWTSFGDSKKRQSYHMIFHASDGQLYSPDPIWRARI